MFQFVKENKVFCAVVTTAVVLLLVFCYGLAIRNVFAVVLGAVALFGGVAYAVTKMMKEVFSK